jgi:hypothetical protein
LVELAVDSIYEAETVKEYRRDLLNSAAGHARVQLSNILVKHAVKKRRKEVQQQKKFIFWDCYDANPTERSADALKEAEARKLQRELTDEVQQIIDFIYKKKVSRLSTALNTDADLGIIIATDVHNALLQFVSVGLVYREWMGQNEISFFYIS